MGFSKLIISVLYSISFAQKFLTKYKNMFLSKEDLFLTVLPLIFFYKFILINEDLNNKIMNTIGLSVYVLTLIAQTFDYSEIEKVLSQALGLTLISFFLLLGFFQMVPILALNVRYANKPNFLKKLYLLKMDFDPGDSEFNSSGKKIRRSLSFSTNSAKLFRTGSKAMIAVGAMGLAYKLGTEIAVVDTALSALGNEASTLSEKCSFGGPDLLERQNELADKKQEMRSVVNKQDISNFTKQLKLKQIDSGYPSYGPLKTGFIPNKFNVSHDHSIGMRKK